MSRNTATANAHGMFWRQKVDGSGQGTGLWNVGWWEGKTRKVGMASLGKNMSIQLESEFLPQKRRFLSNWMMRIRNVEKESHDAVGGIVSHLPPPKKRCIQVLTVSTGAVISFRTGSLQSCLRVPWRARRSNQSVLKEINSEYSLEGLMLKLKLQYLATWFEQLTH